MSEKKKPALTRRLMRQYQSILKENINCVYADVDQFWHPKKYRGGYQAWSKQYVPWAAYYFAKRWNSRDIDLKALQLIVLRAGSAECLFRYAQNVPGANIRRIAHEMLTRGEPDWMRRFVAEILGVREGDARMVLGMAEVTEVMAL